MIRSTSFRTEIEMTKWMNAQGLDISDLYVLWMNASNFWTVFYEDGLGRDVIDTTEGSAGVAFGTAAGVAGPAGATIRMTALRTAVTGESLGTATDGTLSATIANTYVIPDSVVITDGGGVGFTVNDDGYGNLVSAEDGKLVGTVNYATGAVAVQWPFQRWPTGTITCNYRYSSLPDTDTVPVRAKLGALSIKQTVGTAASVAYEIYENAAKTMGPIARGTITLTNGVGVVDLNHVTSCCLDLTIRDSRWLVLIPNTGTSTFVAHMTWERIL
jgi:hypothetical protein